MEITFYEQGIPITPKVYSLISKIEKIMHFENENWEYAKELVSNAFSDAVKVSVDRLVDEG